MPDPSQNQFPPLDILAIAAHRDDVEQTCGGTLLKMAQKGRRTGILDLTQGEMGTRGSADDRAREAAEAARLLRVSWRDALSIPDGRVENTYGNRLQIAQVIRHTRPRVVILPYWKGRHPDHYTCSTLGYEACFLAGLKKLEIGQHLLATLLNPYIGYQKAAEIVKESIATNHSIIEIARSRKLLTEAEVAQILDPVNMRDEGVGRELADDLAPHRPFKIVYATLYYDVRPTFVVDISEQFETRLAALMAYKSQFADQQEGRDIFPGHEEIRDRVHSMARFYGMLAGVKYAEPFLQKEVGLVEDLLAVPVQSI